MKENQQDLIRDFIRISVNCILALIRIERWYGGCGRSSYHDLGQVSSSWDCALIGRYSDDELKEEIHKYKKWLILTPSESVLFPPETKEVLVRVDPTGFKAVRAIWRHNDE
jgi:hypothetical protein